MLADYEICKEITDKVHLIRGKNRSRFPQANSVLIDDEVLTLIDAGAHIDHIEYALKKLGHSTSEIDQIILTHFHIDHKGHAEQLRQKSDCDVLCHPLAEKGVVTFEGMVDYYGIKGHEFFPEWNSLLRSYLPHVRSSFKVTGNFYDRRPISCGEIELIPVHTPGHTIDHTVIGINGFSLMVLVDIDLTRFGPWYGNAVSDITEFKKSIELIISLEPQSALSSHLLEPVSNRIESRLRRYLEEFDKREKQIIEFVKNGRNTIQELVEAPTIYPRLPTKAYRIFEEFMLRKHIEDLEKRKILDNSNGEISII